MNIVELATRLIPSSVKSALKWLIRKQIEESRRPLDASNISSSDKGDINVPSIDANTVLNSLYSSLLPLENAEKVKFAWRRQRVLPRSVDDPLPAPPPELMMGYGTNKQHYLSMGEKTSQSIRRIIEREGISLTEGTSMLEWGCASGRVLRYFAKEAKACEIWGIDQDTSHINWAKENLSPPFRFLTCTAYPHLPFEDGKFTLVYGISVFTHILQLIDMWLMEFRRILAPGGYALFTIHDEHTWDWLKKHKEWRDPWVDWISDEDFSKGLEDDMYVLRRLGHTDVWANLQVFFKSDWVTQEWGRYLEVVAIEPYFEGDYQTMMLLRKPDVAMRSNP